MRDAFAAPDALIIQNPIGNQAVFISNNTDRTVPADTLASQATHAHLILCDLAANLFLNNLLALRMSCLVTLSILY